MEGSHRILRLFTERPVETAPLEASSPEYEFTQSQSKMLFNHLRGLLVVGQDLQKKSMSFSFLKPFPFFVPLKTVLLEYPQGTI